MMMKIELVPNTTEVIEIATEYHTILKIDNEYDIKVTFIELLLDLNTDDKTCHITVDIEAFPSHLTLDQAVDLKLEIETFVKDNSSNLMEDVKKSD